MVKQLYVLFFFCPLFLFSAEFTATVSQTEVNIGNSLTLTLALKGSSPKGTPELDNLKKSFIINSQQQTTHTTIINGQATFGTTWKLVVIPKKEGEFEVPSVSIETNEGIVSTEPILIHVLKGEAASNFRNGLVLSSRISEGDLYKNGTFVYTIQLISTNDLVSLKMENLEIKDAIVEANEKPKIYEKIVDGKHTGVIEFRFYITPIKDGSLIIPSAIIQGGIIVKRKGGGSYFDDDFDPFSMQRFSRIEPFALATEEINVSIKPPIAGIEPWLPAQSLKLEEIWNDSQTLQAGEPFSRVFKISADGLHSSQLPNLNDLQGASGFKIYADKPELGDDFQDSTIHSYRNEQYTIIPQESGSVILPKIEIAWWNTVENKKMIATIPAKKLEILPASAQMESKSQLASSDQATNPSPSTDSIDKAGQSSLLNHLLIGALALLLILSIVWGVLLQRKISKLKESDVKKSREAKSPYLKMQPQRKEKREKLNDLNPT